MQCPKCKGKTQVFDSRPAELGIHRRRKCAKGHRFSTMEMVVEPKAKRKPKPKPEPTRSALNKVLSPRLHRQPARDEFYDDDFESLDLRELGLD